MNKSIHPINNSYIISYDDFLENPISFDYLENLFHVFQEEPNFIRNKSDNSHQALWFGPLDYKYSNYPELKATSMPEHILELAKHISLIEGKSSDYYNSVYINKYVNAGMGKHHDNDSIFKFDKSWSGGKHIEVAVYSLGAPSKIFIYNRNNGSSIFELLASNNSLYIMGPNFQNELLHRVGNSKGIRYSLTFRNCVF